MQSGAKIVFSVFDDDGGAKNNVLWEKKREEIRLGKKFDPPDIPPAVSAVFREFEEAKRMASLAWAAVKREWDPRGYEAFEDSLEEAQLQHTAFLLDPGGVHPTITFPLPLDTNRGLSPLQKVPGVASAAYAPDTPQAFIKVCYGRASLLANVPALKRASDKYELNKSAAVHALITDRPATPPTEFTSRHSQQLSVSTSTLSGDGFDTSITTAISSRSEQSVADSPPLKLATISSSSSNDSVPVSTSPLQCPTGRISFLKEEIDILITNFGDEGRNLPYRDRHSELT
jgi:hypothetical protein